MISIFCVVIILLLLLLFIIYSHNMRTNIVRLFSMYKINKIRSDDLVLEFPKTENPPIFPKSHRKPPGFFKSPNFLNLSSQENDPGGSIPVGMFRSEISRPGGANWAQSR